MGLSGTALENPPTASGQDGNTCYLAVCCIDLCDSTAAGGALGHNVAAAVCSALGELVDCVYPKTAPMKKAEGDGCILLMRSVEDAVEFAISVFDTWPRKLESIQESLMCDLSTQSSNYFAVRIVIHFGRCIRRTPDCEPGDYHCQAIGICKKIIQGHVRDPLIVITDIAYNLLDAAHYHIDELGKECGVEGDFAKPRRLFALRGRKE